MSQKETTLTALKRGDTPISSEGILEGNYARSIEEGGVTLHMEAPRKEETGSRYALTTSVSTQSGDPVLEENKVEMIDAGTSPYRSIEEGRDISSNEDIPDTFNITMDSEAEQELLAMETMSSRGENSADTSLDEKEQRSQSCTISILSDNVPSDTLSKEGNEEKQGNWPITERDRKTRGNGHEKSQAKDEGTPKGSQENVEFEDERPALRYNRVR